MRTTTTPATWPAGVPRPRPMPCGITLYPYFNPETRTWALDEWEPNVPRSRAAILACPHCRRTGVAAELRRTLKRRARATVAA